MRVGICIPVRNDPSGLAATLRSLPRHVAGRDPVVVVGVDGPDSSLEKIARDHGALVAVLPEPRGSYAAREAALGLMPADVEAVLFTDADCLVTPDWAAGHVAALQTADLSGGGVTIPLNARPGVAEYVDFRRNLVQERYVLADGFAATCNLGVRAEVLRDIRFRPDLESGGDRDFCHRATDAGFTLVYTPTAAVIHPARSTWSAVLSKSRRLGRGVASIPTRSRPAELPDVKFSLGLARGHARGRGLRGLPWATGVATLDLLRQREYLRAAKRAGFTASGPPPDIVVLLASDWQSLRDLPTRWYRIIDRWQRDERVRSLTAVSLPQYRRKYLLNRGRQLARAEPSWLPDVLAIRARLPVAATRWVFDEFAYRRLARALHRVLPGSGRSRLVIATHPAWAPVALHIPARRRGFDADDDWRARAASGPLAGRNHDGYRLLSRFDSLSANSPAWATQLNEEFGVQVTPIGNGVDLSAYRTPTSRPTHVPDGPFAVYVGSVEERIDFDLLEAVARAGPLPVVVAGPAGPEAAERLRRGSTIWLGSVEPEKVPGLLKAATVGLLPHLDNDFTRSMDPMKVLEYLAAGLRVVSTPVQLPDGFAAWIEVASSTDEFISAIRQCSDGSRRPPWEALAGRDWSIVASRMLREHGG